MAITLTHVPTGNVLTLDAVLGYQAARRVSTIVHHVIGDPVPRFTVITPQPREGTFRILTSGETTGRALADFLVRPGAFTLADTATNIADTTFMVTGAVGMELDPAGMVRVIVSADYTATT